MKMEIIKMFKYVAKEVPNFNWMHMSLEKKTTCNVEEDLNFEHIWWFQIKY